MGLKSPSEHPDMLVEAADLEPAQALELIQRASLCMSLHMGPEATASIFRMVADKLEQEARGANCWSDDDYTLHMNAAQAIKREAESGRHD